MRYGLDFPLWDGNTTGLIGLSGLGAPLPISLTINSGYQVVGQKPIYRIANATPGAAIYWSSFKNGAQTGESRASYGATVEANGSAELEGGAWTPEDAGAWLKEVEIDGQRAAVPFQVATAANVVDGSALPSGGALSNPLFYVGSFAVTPGILLGGVAALWVAKALKILK